MSFSFSQNLFSDISDSQGSDSSQPLTQPMVSYNTNNSWQNMTMAIPRPPSFPMRSKQSGASNLISFTDQPRSKYTRVESAIPSQSALGDILRETQARITSIPSSSSRMLEEALVFLENKVKTEKLDTLARGKSVSDIVQTVKGVLTERNEESSQAKSLVKSCLFIAESLKEVLKGVAEDQEDATKFLDNLEQSVQAQELLFKDVLIKLNHAADAIDNVREKEVMNEEIMLEKKSENISNHSSRGALMNTRSKNDCLTTYATSFAARRVVRNFPCVTRQVEPIIDFSSVMEVDSDSEDEWEE